MTKVTNWRIKAAITMVCFALTPNGVYAETVSKTQHLLEEVVILGTKKAGGQSLQDAPVAVTGFSTEQLDILKVKDIGSLSYTMPNTSFDSPGTPGVANFTIRGSGINSSVPSVEPAVGTFLDGVYLGNNFAVITDFFDIAGVEVLRGPQGLLFGRNVTGGAILINSARPEEEYSAKIKARLETGLHQTYSGHVNGAISDNLFGRVALYYSDDKGWFDNLADGGSDLGAMETAIVRPSLTFRPSDSSEHTLILEFGKMEGDGGITQAPNLFVDHDTGLDRPGVTDNKWSRLMLESTWDVDFGEGTITNILGWRDIDSTNGLDADGSPQDGIYAVRIVKQDQLSNELRYNGTFGKAEITSGLFYFTQDLEAYDDGRIFGGLVSNPNGGNLDHEAWGVFTQLDYHLTDTLILTAGLRYSAEKKEVEISPASLGACTTFNPDGVPSIQCTTYFDDEEDWSFWTPKLGFSWDIADDATLYGFYTKGYRSGGFNLRQATGVNDSAGNVISGLPPFDEEEQNTFEVGIKTALNDGSTQFNAAVFHSKTKDVQKDITVATIVNGQPTNFQNSFNTADTEVKGVEVELTQQIADALILKFSLGYIDAEYTSITPEGLANGLTTDLEVTRAPKLTAGLNLTYEADLGDSGSLVSALAYQHRDEFFTHDGNNFEVPEVDKFDLNVTYYSPGGAWSASVYGRNLTNEKLISFGQMIPSPPFTSTAFVGLNEGRSYGVEVVYNFQGGQ